MFAARAPKVTSSATSKSNTGFKSNDARPAEQAQDRHRGSPKPSIKSSFAPASSPKSAVSTYVLRSPSSSKAIKDDYDETMYGTESMTNGVAVGDDSLYYKTRYTLVALFGPLPRVVEEALAKTDFYSEPMTAKVDVDAGYGIVVSKSKCYVWAVQKSTYRTPPPCYTFPMPPNSLQSVEASVMLPSVTISNSDDNFSGLLACSPDGTCWYWDNIELSVSNTDQHVDASIPLLQGDHVTHIESAGSMGYFFGTKLAQVHQVTVKKQYGAAFLVTKQLNTQAAGVVTSLFTMMGRGPAPDITQRITSMTSGPRIHDPHGRWDLFAMTRKSLIKWQLSRSGDPAFEADIPIKNLIHDKITMDLSLSSFGMDPKIRLKDVKFIKNGKILLLASFFEAPVITHTTPLTYGLFTLSAQFGREYDIEDVQYIRRATDEDLRPGASPSLVVPHGGPRVFIITPSSVMVKSTEPGNEFEEILPLHNDRIIGYGCEDWRQRSHQSSIEGGREISLICRKSGLLGVHVETSIASRVKVLESETAEEHATSQLLAKLEQAVYYGNKQHNPISFDLTLYGEGDLNKTSLKVNEEILNSHAEYLSSAGDMTARLRERFLKARSIIESISRYKMVGRLSVDTRFKLCSSAEKMAAATKLWQLYQLKLASKDTTKESKELLKQVLHDSVALTDHKLAETKAEDLITLFLKYDVELLGPLLSNLHVAAGKLKNVSAVLREELILDINNIIIKCFKTAWDYREKNTQKYDLQECFSVEPWSGNGQIIQGLTAQYHRTLASCKASLPLKDTSMDVDGVESEIDFSNVDVELSEQVFDLADVTLQASSDRLLFLENLTQTVQTEMQKAQAEEDYMNAKSQLLGPLVGFKDSRRAKELAEKFADFSTLVRLCRGDKDLFEEYIDKYQQPFADALFLWYISQNKISALMVHGEEHSDLFTTFLDNGHHDELAWLHDIKIKRYERGSDAAARVARQETDMDHRETAFSLSKLLLLADANPSETTAVTLGKLDQDLEFAAIQTLVTDEWGNMVGALATIDDQAEAVVDDFGSSLLAEQPTLREALVESARTLLSRQTLSAEDLLDILMVQQKREIENMDVADVALGVCVFADSDEIPDSRRDQVLADVWRRIFISDQDGYWKLGETNDIEARERLMNTWMARAYSSIYNAGGAKDHWLLRPDLAKCSLNEDLFRERFYQKSGGGGEGGPVKAMMEDYERENEELEHRIHRGELLPKWQRVKELVAEAAKEVEHERQMDSDGATLTMSDLPSTPNGAMEIDEDEDEDL